MCVGALGKHRADISGRQLTFRGGSRWLLAFLVLGSLLVIADRYANYVWGIGPPIPIVDTYVGSFLLSLALLGSTIGVLYKEKVPLFRIGLAPRLLVPATVATGGYFLALNVIGIGLALVSNTSRTIGYQWTVSPIAAGFVFVFMFIAAGIVEEVVFRGYLHNKLIAMCPGDQRIQIVVGIVIASGLFSAYHIPRVLTDGPPGAMNTSGYLLLLFVNGLGYSLAYEFTHNLYVPILVHAAGNMPGTAGIFFFHTDGWPMWATTLFSVSYIVVAVLVILAYRRWAFAVDMMPVWTERNSHTVTKSSAVTS